MGEMRIQNRFRFLLAVAIAYCQVTFAWADQPAKDELKFNVLPGIGRHNSDVQEVTFAAEFRAIKGQQRGELRVTASLEKGWTIYSTTQKSGGPTPTQIVVKEGARVVGEFISANPPTIKRDAYFPVPLEEHLGEVTWAAPIEFEGDPEQVTISGKVRGQICHANQGCIPLDQLNSSFDARFAGYLPETNGDTRVPSLASNEIATTSYTSALDVIASLIPTQVDAEPHRVARAHATIEGRIEPASARPGDKIRLKITVTPDAQWHVYDYAERDPSKVSKPALVALAAPKWKLSPPKASQKPVSKQTGLSIEPVQRYHEKPITWTFELQVPSDQPAGLVQLTGHIGLQTCTETMCDPPAGVDFSAKVQIGGKASGSVPLEFKNSSYAAAAKLLKEPKAPEKSGADSTGTGSTQPPEGSGSAAGSFEIEKITVEKSDQSLWMILLLAFVGGFILNFMPCVLPVIGLKVLAFVHQSGHDRVRILLLNLVYSLGLLSIFWILATFASAASLGLSDESLGWGQQFNYDAFNITMLAVVFVMGLSFLGVWEIPIPGFATSHAADELAGREGYSGAFFKGVVTTLLATPCSGPGLASALAYCVNKPPHVVYLVFTFVGLGMALPYLLIGAYPRLIRFIPKPGPWMETFKQVMGFVLLGTVVFLFTVLEPKNIIPTLVFLLALGAACWLIGRVPLHAPRGKRLQAWGWAAALAGIVGWLSFTYEGNSEHDLDWQKFSLARLGQLSESGATVMVDFTADW
jgi:thiol:disulfide interchange protein